MDINLLLNKNQLLIKIDYKITISYIILFLSLIFPFVILNGSVDDFLFQHVGLIYKYKINGHIPIFESFFADRDTGLFSFYSVGLIIGNLTGLPYDVFPFIPIFNVCFIILLYAFLNKINENSIINSLIIFLIMTLTTNLSYFYFHPHGLGFIKFIFFIYVIVIMLKDGKIKINFLILFTLFEANYSSYKELLWIFSFILSCYFTIVYMNKKYGILYSNILKNYFYYLIFMFTIIFGINQYIYQWYFPLFKKQLNFFNAFYNVLNYFSQNTFNILSRYQLNYVYPINLQVIIIVREFMTFLTLILICYKFFYKFNEKIYINYIVFISLILTGVINLLLYILIGLFDIKFISYVSLLGIVLIYKIYHENKKLIHVYLIILLIFNIQYLIVSILTSYAQVDSSYYGYLKPSYNFIEYCEDDTINIYGDVLTKTYYVMQKMKHDGNVNKYHHFSIDVLLYILNYNKNIKYNNIYIVNTKLEHFSITSWRIIKSFKNNNQRIEANFNINKIYDSKYIHTYM